VDEAVASAAIPTPPPPAEVERRINVKLLFEAEDRPGLVMEERAVGYAPDLGTQLELVLRELIRGSGAGLLAPLDPATRVLEVFVTPNGTAYVDLSAEAVPTGGTGSQVEEHSVYAIVNTLTVNFPAVKRVQILVEDRPVVSLAGHTDLSQPLLPDMTLLAPVEVTPSLPPGSELPAPGAP
jgi:spore germination protein GerM